MHPSRWQVPVTNVMALTGKFIGIVERQAIRRGVFTSVRDLNTKIRFHRRLERPPPPLRVDQERRPDPREANRPTTSNPRH
jgi:hypothetical protein